MAETWAIIWIVAIIGLVAIGFLFLLGAAGIISVERDSPDEERNCTCKQTRFAVYANINCPIHGDERDE